MKKLILFIIMILFISCVNNKEKITYSNLVDDMSQQELKSYLENAGIDTKKIEDFLNDVNEFNTIIENVSLVKEGYKTVEMDKIEYDEVEMLKKWEEKYPEDHGHNCRITSFRLLEDFIKIKNPIIEEDTMLFYDKDTLRKNPDLLNKNDEEFLSFFAYIPTEDTKDVNIHVKRLKENWDKKGVEFINDKISLISIVFNTNIEEEATTSKLFIGHIGILFENKDKKLVFLEKLSFSTPYQMTVFENREKLNEYIMKMYDTDKNERIAPPFIMENDKLMEGYKKLN